MPDVARGFLLLISLFIALAFPATLAFETAAPALLAADVLDTDTLGGEIKSEFGSAIPWGVK